MKKAKPLEKDDVRQPHAGKIGKANPPAVVTTKNPERIAAPKRKVLGLLLEHFPDSNALTVPFAYFDSGAQEVFLVGSFNDWQRGAVPLTKQRDGRWCTELLLQPGSYEYRYIVDGEWQDDPTAAHFVANSFGSFNSLVQIPASAA